MKTKLFFTGFFLLSFFYYTVNAQTYRIAVIPKGEKKWGYMNLKGELIIPPQWYLGLPCTKDGTVLTTETGFKTTPKLLFDKDGNEIIPEVKIKLLNTDWEMSEEKLGFKDEILGFSGGMLRQKKAGKWGAINSRGKLTIPFIYSELTEFDAGYALGKREKKFYVLDSDGNETLIERNNEITYIKHFTEGLAPIELNNKRFGFVDTLGKIVIEPEYITVGYFSGGYTWVRVRNNTLGFINKKGEWIIEPRFAKVKGFDRDAGMALVKNSLSESYWSYVDTTGKVSSFKVADQYFGFSEGLAIAKLNSKYGYLNNTGVWEIMPFFDDAQPFINGYAAVKMGKRWGLINKKGEWVLQPEYKAIGEVVVVK